MVYRGRQQIKEMYLRLFASAEGMTFRPIERFATPERVFDDMEATFRLVGDGFENCPFPLGTRVNMRLLHNFHIRDGMIEREIGYEGWCFGVGCLVAKGEVDARVKRCLLAKGWSVEAGGYRP